jgi:ABC-type transport system involved in cytochrome c biogenesis permease component
MIPEATSLFALLFGVPALLFAIVFAAVALKAPRGGAVLSAMLFASVLPVAFWAKSAGYFAVAGPLLIGSLGISALGLLIAAFQLMRPSKKPPSTDARN